MAETLTKRLHISGLTPQISAKDLKDRFSSFGTVKALDGYGKLDGNGEPRPYVYLTLESTKGQLAKCLNLLSGTTWKGAKLRIGEAKPNFRERITKDNEAQKRLADEDASSTRPKKRRRLLRGCQGRHALDMSLTTLENYSKRSGWRKTPLGRLIRVIRMRPPRPLPPPTDRAKLSKGVLKITKLKRKKSVLLTRARRKLIDPTRWGSEYLKGVLLENSTPVNLAFASRSLEMSQQESSEDTSESESSQHADEETPARTFTDKTTTAIPLSTPSPSAKSRSHTPETTLPVESDIAREAAKDLALLASIFGDVESAANDWGGEESLSDIDMEQAQSRIANVADGDIKEIEIVPREGTKVLQEGQKKQKEGAILAVDRDADIEDASANTEPIRPPEPQTIEPKVQTTKLKDMFAPREEDAIGFSLLENLDIDLELDDSINIPAITAPAQHSTQPTVHSTSAPSHSQTHSIPSHSSMKTHFVLDASAPLFFPILDPNLRRTKGKVRDVLDIAKERGWDSAFYRTDSEEAIKQRWEKAKAELTPEWKRRHREGVKSVRRRGGGQD